VSKAAKTITLHCAGCGIEFRTGYWKDDVDKTKTHTRLYCHRCRPGRRSKHRQGAALLERLVSEFGSGPFTWDDVENSFSTFAGTHRGITVSRGQLDALVSSGSVVLCCEPDEYAVADERSVKDE